LNFVIENNAVLVNVMVAIGRHVL